MEGWRELIHGCARAAAEAGVDALRVTPAPGSGVGDLETWIELRKTVLRLNLDFVATAVAEADVEFFRRVGVGGLAVSTGAAAAAQRLLDAAGQSHLPVVLLSDSVPDPGIEAALASLQRYDIEVAVLFGTEQRPAPAEQLGLSRLREWRERRVRLGFADRSGTGLPAVAACALGADLVELPVSLSPFLPGTAGGLDPGALKRAVEGLRYMAWARAHEPHLPGP
jgi:sialic acid synthase SpsE